MISLDLLILIFVLGYLVFCLYKDGWQNFKNGIYQATRKERLIAGSRYWAFLIGGIAPAALTMFIGMQFEWPELIYMSSATAVLIFQLYFLSLNLK